MDEGEPVLRPKSFELLLETVKNKKPKRILEIGVNRGLSGIAMLLSSESSHLSGIEIDEQKIRIPPALINKNQVNEVTIKTGRNLMQTAYIDYDDIEFMNLFFEN